MTIIGNAVRTDLDVAAFLQDVLERKLAGETKWSILAPYTWKAEPPEAIQTCRQGERLSKYSSSVNTGSGVRLQISWRCHDCAGGHGMESMRQHDERWCPGSAASSLLELAP
ncbi:hypothetical protein K227x_46580 [Rubripirellula lacrimiformis]|uniref:Uncharacterized protein n=1 Tax=Rubripirellula lacrimiformis TaxID=1930273 RepID=A0A517NGJ0_9BACT|nr:hypothetical protein K227x_46580 [Rubripirellula lacrimiformis]